MRMISVNVCMPKMAQKQQYLDPELRRNFAVVVQGEPGKSWRLGTLLGQGCCGQVYDAVSEDSNHNVAIKVYISKQAWQKELHILGRIFAPDRVAAYKVSKGITHLGCPKLYGYGKHKLVDTHGKIRKHYFTVMEKLIPLSKAVVYSMPHMCVQLLDVLNYIHSCGWAHADLGTLNTMTDFEGNFYIIDFDKSVNYSISDNKFAWWEDLTCVISQLHYVVYSPRTRVCDLPTPLASIWTADNFIGGSHVKLYNVPSTSYVAKLGVSERESKLFKKLYSTNLPRLPYCVQTGVTDSGLHFLITRKYCNPITHEHIKEITNRLFINLVRGAVNGVTHLHNAGYCHNNVCPENILVDYVTCYPCLVNLDNISGLQHSYSSFVGTNIYAGLDSYTIGATPRNDLDSVVFCMLYWAGLDIPWAHIKDPKQMYEEKIKFIKNPASLLGGCKSNVRRKLIEEIIALNRYCPVRELPDYASIQTAICYAAKNAVDDVHTHGCPYIETGDCHCPTLCSVKDILLVGPQDEEVKRAVAALKYSNLW